MASSDSARMSSGGTKDEFGGTKSVHIFNMNAGVALIIGLYMHP
jgi:hypothetical protein